jgi:hypothetical protein
LEHRHDSQGIRVFRATLLDSIIRSAFALVIGFVFYTAASAQINITMISLLYKGEKYFQELCGMPKKDRISRAELMEELEKKLDLSDTPELNKDMERLSLQSAAFLLGDPKKKAEADVLDPEQTRKLAAQIMRKSGPKYMDWNYGNLPGPGAEKHFEGMLLTVDGLALPEGVDRTGKKEALLRRIRERGSTYGEYLLMNTVRTGASGAEAEKERPGEAQLTQEKTGRIFAALTHCMSKNAGMPALQGAAFDREAQIYSGMPLCRLTFRDRHMASILEHREFGNVAAALKSTQDAFQFAGKDDFRIAQKKMKMLLPRMSSQEYKGEQGEKWMAFKRAARSFANARFHINDADAVISAKLFLATEAFLAGQKGDDPGVELALAALGAGVPDAAHNPGVRTLVDDLNRRRGPEAKRLAVPDYGAPSMASQPKKEPRQPQAETAPIIRKSTPELTL